MLTLQRAHQQQLDSAWTARTGLPLLLLMEQSATAVSRYCLNLVPSGQRQATTVLVLAGKGQNGGDAFACARLLAAENFQVTCLELFPGDLLPQEAQLNRTAWLNLGYRLESPDPAGKVFTQRPDLVIDGIFGTGFRADRPLPGLVTTWSAQIQTWRHSGTRLIAIDLPSGVDANTGKIADGTLVADATVTMIRPKTGICATPGRFCAGEIVVANLGISDSFVNDTFAGQLLPVLIDDGMIRALRVNRHPNSHKGTFGRVLVLGGSPGLPGAVALAAESASRSGAGLVYLGIGESIAPQTLAAVSEALLTALPESDPSQLFSLLEALIAGKQVVAIGPGAGRSPWLDQALTQALAQSPAVVIDADGLNAIARDIERYLPLLHQRRVTGHSLPVLTPHPGEFSRLAPDIDWSDRQAAALALAIRLEAVILLKGASTVIAHPDGLVWINPTGNPGLAKGGSGDVLCGLIAGLMAQGLGSFEAAAAGAYLHGLAADLAADLATGGTGTRSLLPSDVLKALGRAFAAAGWDN
jgi:hydroxyethylthiazole kinase-like uncharacterized protein yjeF